MNSEKQSSSLRLNPGLTLLSGILLMIVSIFVFSAQIYTTVVSILLLGIALVVAGLAQIFYGFFSGSWSKFFFSFIGGVIAAIFGVIMITSPALSAATLTGMIGLFFLIEGAHKILSSIAYRNSQGGWYLAGGIISFLLGISLLAGWPYTGLWFIGFYIGIELFVTGFILTATAYALPADTAYKASQGIAGIKGGEAKRSTKNSK